MKYEEKYWLLDSSSESSAAFKNYEILMKEILSEKILTAKEKHLLIMAIFAVKGSETEMIYHSMSAVNKGAKLEEVIELFESLFISRGISVWNKGRKIIEYLKQEFNIDEVETNKTNDIVFDTIDECKDYLVNEYTELPNWVKLMEKYNEKALLSYSQLRVNSINDGKLSKKFKELVLVGVNASDSYTHGLKVHTNVARELGSSEEEISEVLLIALLTAGGPAWIDGSNFINN